MTKDSILKTIQKLIQDLFWDDTIMITLNTTPSDVEGWDSFEHINILVSIENEFDIQFDMSEVMEVNNIGELIDLVYEAINR